MKSVRILDRTLIDRPGKVRMTPVEARDGRPSVQERFDWYWSGPGWDMALVEARRLLSVGTDRRAVARAIGWTEVELDMALAGRRPDPGPVPCTCLVSSRPCTCGAVPRRTGVVCRGPAVATRQDEIALEGKVMYEQWRMSVPEVGRALGKSRSRTYAMLARVGTAFRRRGRRDEKDLARAQERISTVKFGPRPSPAQQDEDGRVDVPPAPAGAMRARRAPVRKEPAAEASSPKEGRNAPGPKKGRKARGKGRRA